MSDEEAGSPLAGVRAQTSATLADLGRAVSELESVLQSEVRRPAQSLVRDVAGMAEVAVTPLAQFVERQRELADQMAAWAVLQHQLADQMATWADLQRQLAGAMSIWLAPAGGLARLTTRVLHQVAADGSPESD